MQAIGMLPSQELGFYQRFGKRGVDLFLVCLTLPFWMPLTAVLWLIAMIEAGQGSYTDVRVGQAGRRFRCFKIRTMRRGLRRGCAAHKPRDDLRVTPFGCFLRRTSLDELPQLICVLKGEMSLVGPRPVPASELRRYGVQAPRYLALRPGLTGLWQVSGRNALSYRARVALDVRYAHEMSFVGDLAILLATTREVWRMSGR